MPQKHQLIKRAWFIAKLYKTAATTYPARDFTEVDYRWKGNNKFFYIKWLEGEQAPSAIKRIEDVDISDDEMTEGNELNNGDFSDSADDGVKTPLSTKFVKKVNFYIKVAWPPCPSLQGWRLLT